MAGIPILEIVGRIGSGLHGRGKVAVTGSQSVISQVGSTVGLIVGNNSLVEVVLVGKGAPVGKIGFVVGMACLGVDIGVGGTSGGVLHSRLNPLVLLLLMRSLTVTVGTSCLYRQAFCLSALESTATSSGCSVGFILVNLDAALLSRCLRCDDDLVRSCRLFSGLPLGI